MRLAALIQSYGATDFLLPVLRQFNWIDQVLVMNCKFSYALETEDRTLDIIKEAKQKNIAFYHGLVTSQQDSYNLGLQILHSYDRVFICDSDEITLPEDQKRLVELSIQYGNIAAKIIDYASLDLTKVYEHRTHHPIVMCDPKTTTFGYARCSNGVWNTDEVTVHHFGYLIKNIQWKKDWGNKVDEGAADKLMSRNVIDFIPAEELLEALK